MKIRFLFYKAKLGDGHVIDNLISGWTGLLSLFRLNLNLYGFSHMEVWIPEPECFNGFEWQNMGDYQGLCFSSASRGDRVGVRWAPANEVLKHPKRWSYVECDVDLERLEVAMQESNKLVNKPYDYAGIWGFVIPFVKNNPDKWYCSEVCCWFGKLCNIYKKKHKMISPLRAAQILIGCQGRKLKKL